MTATEILRANASFSTRGGALRINPLVAASERWGPDGDVTALRAWMEDETTKQMIELIKELTFNPPPGLVSPDKLENYGMTTGLQLAVRVLEDPTILFAHVFEANDAGGTALPDADYTTGAYEDVEK